MHEAGSIETPDGIREYKPGDWLVGDRETQQDVHNTQDKWKIVYVKKANEVPAGYAPRPVPVLDLILPLRTTQEIKVGMYYKFWSYSHLFRIAAPCPKTLVNHRLNKWMQETSPGRIELTVFDVILKPGQWVFYWPATNK
jgi:hypothetical protein